MRRTGGSTTSARGRARRGAPARLGRRRRRCADAEARRHGRGRVRRAGAGVSQRRAHRDLCSRQRTGRIVGRRGQGAPAALRVEPRLRMAASLVATVEFTTRAPFTLTYHIRPEARWSDGVPVSARDFVFTHETRSAKYCTSSHGGSTARSAAFAPSTPRRCGSYCARATADWRFLFADVLPSHALAGRISRRSGATGSTTRGRASRSGAAPSSSSAGSAAESSSLVRNPRYWGPHPAYLDRLVLRFRSERARPGRCAAARRGRRRATASAIFVSAELEREAGSGLACDVAGGGLGALRVPGRARRSSGAAEQARAAGARVRHRPCRARPGGLRRGRPRLAASRQHRASSTSQPLTTGRTGAATRYRPARARPAARAGGLPPRRGRHLRRAPASGSAALRRRRAGPAVRERVLELVQTQLRAGGRRGRAGTFCPAARFFGQILPSGDFDARALLLGRRRRAVRQGDLRLRRGPRTSPATASGSSRATSTRRSASSTPSSGRACSTESTPAGRAVPVLPLFQPVVLGAARATRGATSLPARRRPFVGAEDWWLARLALAAALAVALLAVPGAGGSGAQAPGAVGRSSTEGRPGARLPERRSATMRPGNFAASSGSSRAGSRGAVRRRSRTSRGGRASSRASRTRRGRRSRSRTTFAPRRAGATGCRHRTRLRLHPPGDPPSGRASRLREPHSDRFAASAPRREDGEGRPASRFAAGGRSFANVLPAHALAGADLAKVWTDRIDNPKTGAPIGSGPFLVERWERGKQLTFVRNPATGGRTLRTSTGSSFRFRFGPGACVEAFRRGELDVASHFPLECVAELRQVRASGSSRPAAAGWDHFEIRVGPGGHPALATSSCGGRSPTGSTGARSSSDLGEADRRSAATRQRRLPDQEPPLPAELERLPLPPGRARRLLEQAGCRRGADGIYVCAGERLSLRSLRSAGRPVRARAVELVRRSCARRASRSCRTSCRRPALFDQILAKRATSTSALLVGLDPAANRTPE